MSYETQVLSLNCPYCGEKIDVIVDLSVDYQEYIEDCSVCCQPITLVAVVAEGEAAVTARHEND